jgi:hypothetical protein
MGMLDHPLIPALRFWIRFAALSACAVACPALGLFVIGFLFNSACCCSCTIYGDDYTTDKTGTDYTTVSGTFTVSGGELNTSSANATIRTNAAASAAATAVVAQADITCATTSDIGRVYIAYTDATHYVCAELQPGATNGTIKIIKDGATLATSTVNGYTSGTLTVGICYALGYITATAGVYSASSITSVTVASKYAALGTGAGISSVKFDNFTFKKHHHDVSSCPNCFPSSACSSCIVNTTPIEVQITYTGVANGFCTNCENLNQTFLASRNDAFDPCIWQLSSAARVCASSVSVQFIVGSTHYPAGAPGNTAANWGSTGDVAYMTQTLPTDCGNELTLTTFNTSAGPLCDNSGATVTISPI